MKRHEFPKQLHTLIQPRTYVPTGIDGFCQELILLELGTAPTGVVAVLSPNASRDGVPPAYERWTDVAMSPDPQVSPDEVLKGSNAHDPERLLASAG